MAVLLTDAESDTALKQRLALDNPLLPADSFGMLIAAIVYCLCLCRYVQLGLLMTPLRCSDDTGASKQSNAWQFWTFA